MKLVDVKSVVEKTPVTELIGVTLFTFLSAHVREFQEHLDNMCEPLWDAVEDRL